MPKISGGGLNARELSRRTGATSLSTGISSPASAGAISRVTGRTLRKGAGMLCGPWRKQQLWGSSQAGPPENSCGKSAGSVLRTLGQHGRPSDFAGEGAAWRCAAWCIGMSAAISCPGRMCPACMASIGAAVISAQAAMTSNSTDAIVLLAILGQCGTEEIAVK